MITYRIPAGVQAQRQGRRVLLSTREGGRVVIDADVLAVWQAADGRSLAEILEQPPRAGDPGEIRTVLACLAEAGLLARHRSIADSTRTQEPCSPMPQLLAAHDDDARRVSAILVSYNSRAWLDMCLASLQAQTCPPLEIILVDNASQDGSAEWTAAHYPQVQVICLEQPQSLATALNLGIQAAHGDYYCLLNPDIRLEPEVITHMLMAAQRSTSCAAVAARLHLLWAPAFLNGMGNFVGAFAWGSDYALGHLNLGQFERWSELPSACFAAALIPAPAFQAVGPLDEAFPMYYEDSEWCYRARLMGYSIQAAPAALVYHAFGGQSPGQETQRISTQKLRCVAYGRLRFNALLNEPQTLRRFLIHYAVEDWLRVIQALSCFYPTAIAAYARAWDDFRRSLAEIRLRRRTIQAKRQCADAEIYRLQKGLPPPLVWNGLPVLTWDIICNQYIPLIASGQTRLLPEFSSSLTLSTIHHLRYPVPLYQRALRLWQTGGPGWALYWLGKHIQWRLMEVGI